MKDKIVFTKDILKDMLKFAIEKEYYEKAVILRDFLNQNEDENKSSTLTK